MYVKISVPAALDSDIKKTAIFSVNCVFQYENYLVFDIEGFKIIGIELEPYDAEAMKSRMYKDDKLDISDFNYVSKQEFRAYLNGIKCL